VGERCSGGAGLERLLAYVGKAAKTLGQVLSGLRLPLLVLPLVLRSIPGFERMDGGPPDHCPESPEGETAPGEARLPDNLRMSGFW
jgi:hypothetical protein